MKIREYLSSEISAVIDEYVNGRNAERDRAILKRYYIDGITQERLSEEFSLSPKQIQRIKKTRENRIFQGLEKV